MRAVIYTRVSSDPRDTGRSVDEQEKECRAVCQREGWEVVRVFTDNDRGASRHSRKARPAYAALRDMLEHGGADVLVLWEGSRAQRDMADYLSLRDLCATRGVLYNYSGRTHDLSRTDDRFTTALDALLAEREADVTRDRVLRSVRANAASGRPHGKLAYGYTRTYDERGVFVSQDVREDQAAVIREAARRTLAGDSLYAIAQDLNARSVPAPAGGQWLPGQIKRLLTNPRYVGQRVHRGVVVGDAAWSAILDEGTYLACKARLEDPRRNVVRDRSLKHLLSGLARCGVCGSRMRVIKNRGYLAYSCKPSFCTAVRTTHLDEYVTALVHDRLSRPDFLELLAAPAATGRAEDALGEVRALKERLDGFYAASAAGQISPAGLAAVEARLLAEIKAAEDRAMAARVPAVLREIVGQDIVGRWDALEVGTRREVVELLMVVKVNRTVRGSRFTPDRVAIEWRSL